VARVLPFMIVEMRRELQCADVFKGSSHVERGTDIRALMVQYMTHAREVHHVASPTPALRIQAMVAMREVEAQID
jgi:hypothetical protein